MRPGLSRPPLRDSILAVPGCVALWPCDDRSAAVLDVVGGGGLGTPAGGARLGAPSIVPGDGGASISFDGAVGSKVTGTGTNLPMGGNSTDWTILAWIYSSVTLTASTVLFGYGGLTASPSHKGRRFLRFNSHVYFWGDDSDLDSTVDYTVGKPQLIAATNANGTVTTSKDGVLVASGAPSTGAFVTPATQAWGMSEKVSTFEVTMNGRISHFGIFNRALFLNELRHLATVAAGN